MATEIEKKFLVKILDLEFYKSHKPQLLHQGYISITPEIRVRTINKQKFLLTIKGEGTIKRDEFEVEIPSDVFKKLWIITKGKRIVKARYVFSFGRLKAEVDVYLDRKLSVLEVELPSVDYHLDIPTIEKACRVKIIKDVTEDKSFKNKNLAK